MRRFVHEHANGLGSQTVDVDGRVYRFSDQPKPVPNDHPEDEDIEDDADRLASSEFPNIYEIDEDGNKIDGTHNPEGKETEEDPDGNEDESGGEGDGDASGESEDGESSEGDSEEKLQTAESLVDEKTADEVIEFVKENDLQDEYLEEIRELDDRKTVENAVAKELQ